MLKANNCFVRSIWKQSMSKNFHSKRPSLQLTPNPNKFVKRISKQYLLTTKFCHKSCVFFNFKIN